MFNCNDNKMDFQGFFYKFHYYINDSKLNESKGLIIGEDISPLLSEEEAYESICDIADTYIGTRIYAVAKLEPYKFKEREQLFRSRIRAIYRASVWGQFSLLCLGASSAKELCDCYDILNEVFCELVCEGREFNGFIRKGVCIDTPMLLYEFPSYPKFDFLCFDFYKLLDLCTGKNASPLNIKDLSDSIRKLCSRCGYNEASIKVYDNKAPEEIIKHLYPLKINEVYFFY